MRSPIRKELLTCFKREFEPRFPRFMLDDKDGDAWWWVWKLAPTLKFFVMLQANGKRDNFIIEVAWSEDGEFPWGGLGKGIEPHQPQGRQRLGRLWEKGADEPVWDAAPEKTMAMQEDFEALARKESPKYLPDPPIDQILPRVCPLVCDAVEKFEQYGIPLFRRVAEARGLGWPNGIIAKLPNGFSYPTSYLDLINAIELPDVDPWRFLSNDKENADFWLQALQEQYPKRLLIPFAKRDDVSDTLAAFDGEDHSGNPKVFHIHAFSGPGWEQRGTWKSFEDWLKQAHLDSVEFKADDE